MVKRLVVALLVLAVLIVVARPTHWGHPPLLCESCFVRSWENFLWVELTHKLLPHGSSRVWLF